MQRFNPFWFDSEGIPTSNLFKAYEEIRHNISKIGYNLFQKLDPEVFSYHVIGSNANGTWRSLQDTNWLLEMYSEKSLQTSLMEFSNLRTFYTQEELSGLYMDNVTIGDFLPHKGTVSDLDFKLTGKISPKQAKALAYGLCDITLRSVLPNEFWNGTVHVFYNSHAVAPYFSFSIGWKY